MRACNRRRFLHWSGVCGCFVFSGCSNISLEESDTTSKLGRVEIVNRDTTTHTVGIRVERDDETVHEESYVLAANDPNKTSVPGVVIGRTWSSTAADYAVSARLNSDQWQTITPAQEDNPRCFSVLINIDAEGQMALFTSSNTERCPQ